MQDLLLLLFVLPLLPLLLHQGVRLGEHGRALCAAEGPAPHAPGAAGPAATEEEDG